MGGKPKPVTCFVETTPQSYESNGFAPTKYHKGGRAEARKSASSRHGGSGTSHTRTSPYPTQFDSSHSSSQPCFSESSYPPTIPSFSTSPPGNSGTSQIPLGVSRSSRNPLSRTLTTSIPSGYAAAGYPSQTYAHSTMSYDSQTHDELSQIPPRNRSSEWYPSLPPHENMDLHQSSPYPMAQQQQQHFQTSYPAWAESSVSSVTSAYRSPYTHQEPTSYSIPPGYGGHGGFPNQTPTPGYGGQQGYPSEFAPTWPPYDNQASFERYH